MFCSSPPLGPMMNRQFPLGVQAAACARVGNALGAGDTERALLVTKIGLGLSCQSHISCRCNVTVQYVRTGMWIEPQKTVTLSHLPPPVTFSCCESIFLGATKDVIGYMFTSDEWVTCFDRRTCWTSKNLTEKSPKNLIHHKGRSSAWCPICSTPTASSCCSTALWWVQQAPPFAE